MLKSAALLFSVFLLASACQGQANDVAVLGGGVFSPKSGPRPFACPVNFPNCGADPGSRTTFAVEGAFAHRIANGHIFSLHLELPVFVIPDRSVGHGGINYSGVFVSPGLKLKIHLPSFAPFFTAGAGAAHFSGNAPNGSNTEPAVEFGGGLDISSHLPVLGFRVELRELYSTSPPHFSETRHNVFVGGGIALNF